MHCVSIYILQFFFLLSLSTRTVLRNRLLVFSRRKWGLMPAFRLVFLDPGYLSDVSKKQFNGAEWWMCFLGGESSFMENKKKKNTSQMRRLPLPRLALLHALLLCPFFYSLHLSFLYGRLCGCLICGETNDSDSPNLAQYQSHSESNTSREWVGLCLCERA